MKQLVTLQVKLTFEAEKFIEADIATLKLNVREALMNWASSSESGLCPEEAHGYTTKVEVGRAE